MAASSTTRLISLGGRTYDAEDATTASRLTRSQVEEAARVGCYYCCRVFDAIYVDEFLSEPERAICPYCGVDALLIESSEWPMHPKLLAAIRRYHFW